MSDSLSSSDEDIYCGPLTLKEIKREFLKGKPQKIKHRMTTTTDFAYSSLSSISTVDNKNENSFQGASSYVTADSSFENSDTKSLKNEEFLNKLTEVIENNSLANILNNADDKISNLSTFQQTLIENTLQCDGAVNNSVISISSNSEDEVENESLVVITDESFNDVKQENDSVETKTNEMTAYMDDLAVSTSENKENCNLDNFTKDSIELERSKGDSLCFNDTLEEMEMALKQGLNYEMPQDQSPVFKTPIVVSSQIPKKKQEKASTKTFDYIRSPIGEYIKQKSPQNLFKQPLKPVKPKPQLQSPALPSKFKQIVSPVGIYIKNSPAPCLKQNIPAKTVDEFTPSVRSNLFPESSSSVKLPEVVYKEAKNVRTVCASRIPLPPSIGKLIQKPVVAKHELRLGKMSEFMVRDKLLDENLTADSTALSETLEDMSLIVTKQAFIK